MSLVQDYTELRVEQIELVNSSKSPSKLKLRQKFKAEPWFFKFEKLPINWLDVNILDVTWLVTCGVAKRPEYVDDGIPFLSAQNARPFKTNLNKIRYITEEQFKTLTVGGKPEKNDILYTRVGNCGEAAKIPYDFDFGIYVSLTLIKPIHELIDSDYLVAYLNSQYGLSQANVGAIGTGLKNLNVNNVRKYRIPLPPLPEQQRVVAKLDRLFAHLEEVKTRLEKVPELLKQFKQSVLTQAVTGKLTEEWREGKDLTDMYPFIKELGERRKQVYLNSVKLAKENGLKKPKKDFEFVFERHQEYSGWVKAKLDNLIYMSARIGWKGLKADEYTDEGPLFLSVHSLNYGENVVFDKAYHITNERYEESPEIMLEENDVLLCKDGAGIGKLGIVKNLTEKATVNSSLLVIRGREALNYKYLYYFLAGPALQNIARERITGTAIPHLFQRDIKGFNLDIPSLEEQTEIVRRVEGLFAKAEAIEAKYEQLKTQIDNLPQALLAKAFKGELVEQLPTDGDARELLEEIKKLKEESK